MKTRKEIDSLGSVEVPADSYGGSFMARALENFQISSLRPYPSFRKALAVVKLCSAQVNADFGFLPKKYAKAIEQAAEEFINGDFDEDYDIDVYQAGAGTPFNMNLNEILANRANEILGGKKGEYKPIHPNDHVNMSQSSNDTIPTAIRLAALIDLPDMVDHGEDLVKALRKKAKEFEKVLKVGRTHLQDAVPITLGQEFEAYASSLEHCLERVEIAAGELMELGIGGTAIGTGINTHPQHQKKMCAALGKYFGVKFDELNRIENNSSLASFVNLSSSLRMLATELLRICSDIRMMASGPEAGFNEVHLPEVEPGSSIMPGKVNPSVFECMSMICVQVMGLDHAIAVSAQHSQLELNWYTPLVSWNLLHQIEILGNGMRTLREHGIEGMKANKKHMRAVLDRSFAMATALNPHLGYHEVAKMVQESRDTNTPFVELVKKEDQKYLNIEDLTEPNRK